MLMEQNLLSDDDCKKIISKVAKKLCVRPKLITERLLSVDDKNDMRAGDLPIEALECFILAWMASGMPDYAHGMIVPLDVELKQASIANETTIKRVEPVPGIRYRMPFVDPLDYIAPSSS